MENSPREEVKEEDKVDEIEEVLEIHVVTVKDFSLAIANAQTYVYTSEEDWNHADEAFNTVVIDEYGNYKIKNSNTK